MSSTKNLQKKMAELEKYINSLTPDNSAGMEQNSLKEQLRQFTEMMDKLDPKQRENLCNAMMQSGNANLDPTAAAAAAAATTPNMDILSPEEKKKLLRKKLRQQINTKQMRRKTVASIEKVREQTTDQDKDKDKDQETDTNHKPKPKTNAAKNKKRREKLKLKKQREILAKNQGEDQEALS